VLTRMRVGISPTCEACHADERVMSHSVCVCVCVCVSV